MLIANKNFTIGNLELSVFCNKELVKSLPISLENNLIELKKSLQLAAQEAKSCQNSQAQIFLRFAIQSENLKPLTVDRDTVSALGFLVSETSVDIAAETLQPLLPTKDFLFSANLIATQSRIYFKKAGEVFQREGHVLVSRFAEERCLLVTNNEIILKKPLPAFLENIQIPGTSMPLQQKLAELITSSEYDQKTSILSLKECGKK